MFNLNYATVEMHLEVGFFFFLLLLFNIVVIRGDLKLNNVIFTENGYLINSCQDDLWFA